MASGTNQLDEIFATTFPKVKKTLADNITTEVPLLAALNAWGRVTEDGGRTIDRQVLYALNDTVGSYDGYDPIDVTPQDGFGYATYSWKQYGGSVTIDGRTEALNEGSARIIPILQAKFDQLKVSTEMAFDVMLWGDGTGNSSKDFLGIQAIVKASGTLGGIDPTTETWWKSRNVSTDLGMTTTAVVSSLNSMLNSLKLQKSRPRVEFTTQENYEAYEALAVEKIQYTSTKLAELGFETIAHKGAEVMFDSNCPDGYWYFLNPEHLEFVQHSSRWLKLLDFVRPADQDAKTALVISMGNLVTDVRRAHGYFSDINPT
jgi:hypothetical protein